MSFTLRALLLLLPAAMLAGCVTINIYFPAAAAEKAADKIIDEVWQIRKPQGTEDTTKGKGTAPAEPRK